MGQSSLRRKVVKDTNNTMNSSSGSARIPPYAWKVLAVLSCIATMVMYAETMLIPAIPDLIKYFHVSYSMSSWILTAYLVSGAVMTPISGKLSDVYGRKKILLIIMVIYAVGVSLSGFATNIYFMLVARAIQGIGMSMFPIAFSIVRDQFPREKMSIGQGIITSMFASGAVIGLAVGGIIIQNYGWRMTFFTIIPVAIALLLIIRRFIRVDDRAERHELQQIPEINQKQSRIVEKVNNITKRNQKNNNNQVVRHIDIKGSVTLATTITLFLLTLTFIETSGSNNIDVPNVNVVSSSHTNEHYLQPLLPSLVAGGIASLIMFIIVERRSENPLLDFQLMLNKSILPANLIIMIVGLSMFMVFQTIPILIRNPEPIGFSEDAITTGKVQLPFAIILLIFGPTSGFIVSKLGSLNL